MKPSKNVIKITYTKAGIVRKIRQTETRRSTVFLYKFKSILSNIQVITTLLVPMPALS